MTQSVGGYNSHEIGSKQQSPITAAMFILWRVAIILILWLLAALMIRKSFFFSKEATGLWAQGNTSLTCKYRENVIIKKKRADFRFKLLKCERFWFLRSCIELNWNSFLFVCLFCLLWTSPCCSPGGRRLHVSSGVSAHLHPFSHHFSLSP